MAVFASHPNDGESTVTTMEQAQAYCKTVVPECFAQYEPLKRLPYALHCCHCGTLVAAANTVPMNAVPTLTHAVMIQQFTVKLMYIMAFHCKEPKECGEQTAAHLNTLIKTKLKPASTPATPVTPAAPATSITPVAPDTPTVPASPM